MSRYEVDSSRIALASTTVGAAVESLRTEVSSMNVHLIDLQSSWQGSAAAQFAGLMEDWALAQKSVEDSLDNITLALTQASTLYSDTESQAGKLFAH